jgi:glycosyltransferase involved in cell wall biosynthesis
MTRYFPTSAASKVGWPWSEDALADASSGLETRWPRITVVTPSYNQGRFIEETIRSVLLQGYPNLEYIIIDGGSTDESVEIIRKYAPWLTYWVSERDHGQSDAINKGWQRATGDILAWLNADDLYLPDTFFQVASAWRSNPEAGLFHGLCEEFDNSGVQRVIGSSYDMKTAISIGYDEGGRVAQPAAFLTRTALQRVGMLDCRLKQSMDKDIFQRVGSLYSNVHIPRVLARFRLHPDQLSQVHGQDSSFFIHSERLMALNNLFSLEQLPVDIRRLRRRSMALHHLHFAQELRFAGQTALAFKHLALSLGHHIAPVLSGSGLRTLSLALAGPTLARWLSPMKRFVCARLANVIS